MAGRVSQHIAVFSTNSGDEIQLFSSDWKGLSKVIDFRPAGVNQIRLCYRRKDFEDGFVNGENLDGRRKGVFTLSLKLTVTLPEIGLGQRFAVRIEGSTPPSETHVLGCFSDWRLTNL